jgi:hypothetical protein
MTVKQNRIKLSFDEQDEDFIKNSPVTSVVIILKPTNVRII